MVSQQLYTNGIVTNARRHVTSTAGGGEDHGASDHNALVESFDSYIVVSVLTATASFAAQYEDAAPRLPPVVGRLTVLACVLSSMGGIYATVVFSFSSIYGRTAMGLGRTDDYLDFLARTSHLRHRAFQLYLLSMVLFVIILAVAAVDRIGTGCRSPLAGLLLVLGGLCCRDWWRIIEAAGPIFAPRGAPSLDANQSGGARGKRE